MTDELYFWHVDKHLPQIKLFYKLIPLFWLRITRHVQSTQNKFAYLCSISKKSWGVYLIFCLQIKTRSFYKLIVSSRVCKARHVQSTRKNKFTIFFQYLKKNVKDEADFFLLIIVKGFFKVILSF